MAINLLMKCMHMGVTIPFTRILWALNSFASNWQMKCLRVAGAGAKTWLLGEKGEIKEEVERLEYASCG